MLKTLNVLRLQIAKKKLNSKKSKRTRKFKNLQIEIQPNDEGRKVSFISLEKYNEMVNEILQNLHQKIAKKEYFCDDFQTLITHIKFETCLMQAHLKATSNCSSSALIFFHHSLNQCMNNEKSFHKIKKLTM